MGALTQQGVFMPPSREYINHNEQNKFFWTCKNEHPQQNQQAIVLTKTDGQYGGPQGPNISSSTTISIPVQQYVFQYKKIYSSTQYICFSAQHNIFQYTNMFFSTAIYIPVHKYVFQYNNIYSSTDSIAVRNYKFQNRNIYSNTRI